ncbi:DNA polymerase clamp loader subunit [Erwinia phage phiEa2809]|uniref:Sliding-clamp-loader small subunit n=1 Tax=Erwinia phage phiEa2809 TaxID=1564096 RepID=A0A0A0YR84_9CAUD|nr:clamp loader of DNA polymerase [Erwinia phage phiEa2809]AIX13102.1 DNA polymerase clamp loader subunit [Erwinia phage phiEa2809]
MAGPGLFDFANALTGSDAVNGVKNNLLATDDPEVKKAFDPFMTRRALAQNMDTIVCAEQMNLLHPVDNWLQWNYALHSIAPRKRYGSWAKKSAADPDILLISDFYQINHEKAAEYLQIFTDEQMEQLRTAVANQNNNEVKGRKAK